MPIEGVRYNVIRRPLAGGRHSIKQKESETADEFYKRLGDEIALDPEFFFMRWTVTLTKQDIEKFEQTFLIPCLEELCDWYDIVTNGKSCGPLVGVQHYRMPFGVYSSLLDGGSTDLDEYLAMGSEGGLVRTNRLFRELGDA